MTGEEVLTRSDLSVAGEPDHQEGYGQSTDSMICFDSHCTCDKVASFLSTPPFSIMSTAAAETETASGTKNSPVFSYRSGNVRGSVFADELSRKDGNGSFSKYRASIQKFYKKKDSDDWAYTSNFDEDELFDVHLVAEELYKFIKADRATGSN